ncbi:6-hydroxymethylpterin diphosphokinase MptE-like protein [Guyparkeria halophila]|uniref:6-hydroxymethylpterin diphosphokinase MptE-like protein n=1 Tax=Guyparkeria halophila TaxID=47960 RepID=A0ABZ0Z037_9GAMM|nr:6-hydroxymethylpterin diphosphokinase MptE-like protein [Guyparkeria halophila]WQH17139.1 6-hydroxymethylpterin diphosphokinase MptE-like protein [Guyparkeria halophila]
MTPVERTSPANPDYLGSLESSREWLQTQHGDWILPSINARHFGSPRYATEDESKSHAQKVLAEHFGERLHQEDRLYIIIGSDSGQLLRFIREHAPMPRGSRWLVIEPNDVLLILRQNPVINTYCDDYVQLVAFDEWQEQATLLQLPAYFRIDGVRLEPSLGALDNTDPQYVELTAHLDAHLTAERFQTTAKLNVAPFIEPNILSAPNFQGGIDPFENLFVGQGVVIIAGGPSLDDQIDWIRENRLALFVIAVSRVSARLQDMGIMPDIVVTVDPFPISLTVSRQMFDFPAQTILMTSSHPYPAITNRWPYSLYCVGPLVPWEDTAVNDQHALPATGPTVTHMAAQLAVHMGFTEIVFCGLDLCHAPDGRTHAAGSSEASAGPIMDFSALPVTTNRGESTWTSPDYFAGIRAMAEIAGQSSSVRFVNPSANAAAIDDVEFVPLESISLPPTKFDRSSLDRIRQQTTRTDRETHLNSLAKSMETITEDMRKVANLAQLGLESNQAYFNLTHPARQKRHKRRMQAIDRLFEGRYRQAARLAQRAAKRAILRTALPHDFFELDRQQAENLAGRYYDAIREEARRLVSPLKLACNRIETRLLELREDVDSEELASRYREFEEPERIGWLETNRETTSGPQAERARLAYASSIETLLEKDRDRHRRKRSPRASLRQIERQFTSQKRQALASLAGSLEHHKEVDMARPYARYANGLLNELSGDLLAAADNHTKVVEQADPQQDAVLLEHALLRLSHINLEAAQSADALAILQTAATLNPTHWRLVARLALVENDAENGITALTRHLEHFPSDVRRIKQMVRLFVALQIPDGIDFCEQYLPYCSPTGRSELQEFLDQARVTLEMPPK